MRFCRQCGRTLAILNDSKAEYCNDCIADTAAGAPRAAQETPRHLELLSATLSVKDGKIVLESQEGWLLWSGQDDKPHSFKLIVDQAAHILKIRKRKHK
jgi:hypothetical protein